MLKLVSDSKRSITPAHIIVVGNEKGGSGKTTTSVHLAMALMKNGFQVGTIDLDSRQQSLNRYFENRDDYMKHYGAKLQTPEHYFIPRAIGKETVFEIEQDEHNRFMTKLNQLKQSCDFVVIDTPGSSTFLARLAHSYADTIITPINDSFIDFDVLARIDNNTGEILRPSIYSEMVWNQRMVRAQREGSSRATDWIVMCNRLSHLDAKNKRSVLTALDKLSARIGFRVVPGFTERVIYRELFLSGLTLLDIMDENLGIKVTLSHVAARVELRDLLSNLKIIKVAEKLGEENFEAAESVTIAV